MERRRVVGWVGGWGGGMGAEGEVMLDHFADAAMRPWRSERLE